MAKTVFARIPGGNWSANATWSTTSGGTADTTKPVATDTANLDGNSGQVTIDTASACAVLNCTGYTGVLTGSNMTTTGNITFVVTMTFTPNTDTWTMGGSMTLIDAGKSFYNLTFNVTGTYTLTTGTLNITNTLSVASSVTATYATNNITTVNLTLNTSSILARNGGTTTISGTWSGAGKARTNVSLTATSTVSGTVHFSGDSFATTITAVSGVTTTGSTLAYDPGVQVVFNTSGMKWNNLTQEINVGTFTLASALDIGGNWSFLAGNNSVTGAFAITLQGNLTLGASGTITGANTQTLTFNGTTGTQTWSGAQGFKNCAMTINSTCIFAISGSVTPLTLAFTITAATSFTATGTAIITFSASTTITISQLFAWAGSITTTASQTFAGSAGFTISGFNCSTSGSAIINTFTQTNTYTVTGAGSTTSTIVGTLANPVTMVSSHASNKVPLTFNTGSNPLFMYCNLTRIDANPIANVPGMTVLTQGGTVTTCNNCYVVTYPTGYGVAY